MDATVRHLNEITTYSRNNLERAVQNLSIQHATVPEMEKHAVFPCVRLPFMQNDKFFGRESELQKITNHLTPRGDVSELRTYTIYGRRGVGKSDIALQYAYKNPSDFDAIFWIQCETSISLRQSFTDIAVHLKLPGVDKNGTSQNPPFAPTKTDFADWLPGHHEENLLSVQRWLKLTSKSVELIFFFCFCNNRSTYRKKMAAYIRSRW